MSVCQTIEYSKHRTRDNVRANTSEGFTTFKEALFLSLQAKWDLVPMVPLQVTV